MIALQVSDGTLELPADASREQGHDEGVEADSLVGGEGGQARVKVRRHPYVELSARVGHLTDGTSCGTMCQDTETAGRRANAPGPATGVWS